MNTGKEEWKEDGRAKAVNQKRKSVTSMKVQNKAVKASFGNKNPLKTTCTAYILHYILYRQIIQSLNIKLPPSPSLSEVSFVVFHLISQFRGEFRCGVLFLDNFNVSATYWDRVWSKSMGDACTRRSDRFRQMQTLFRLVSCFSTLFR